MALLTLTSTQWEAETADCSEPRGEIHYRIIIKLIIIIIKVIWVIADRLTGVKAFQGEPEADINILQLLSYRSLEVKGCVGVSVVDSRRSLGQGRFAVCTRMKG